MTLRYLAVAAILLLSSGTPQGGLAEVVSRTLENGLELYVVPDHRAPVVAVQIWYRVGSRDEHAGNSGISHALEHMMFQGTAQHGPGEFARLISERGGRQNAFTTRDATMYFERIHRDHLALCLELEADRMLNLRLSEASWLREREVIVEERIGRVEDNPAGKLFEQLRAAAFLNGSQRLPIIGWMSSIQALEIEQLKRWYEQWYAPNNVAIVIAGDVAPAEALHLVQRFFGQIPGRGLPSRHLQPEMPQTGNRRITVAANTRLPRLLFAYKAPGLLQAADEKDAYALTLLAGVLDNGTSGRLGRTLVRTGIAASARAAYDLYEAATTLFTISATPASGIDTAELERTLRAQLDDIRSHLVEPDELRRVLAQISAADVYRRDSVFRQAMRIGSAAMRGISVGRLNAYRTRLAEVTPADLRRVARHYLRESQLTVAELLPDDS